MAYRRRSTNRRKLTYKRKRYARKARPARSISTVNRGVSFKRTWFSTIWDFNTAAVTGFWQSFRPRFTDIPNSSEYISLFDQFKVTGVKVTFHPRWLNVNMPANITTSTLGNSQFYMTYCKSSNDFDWTPTGTYTSANYNAFLEEGGSSARTVALNRPVSVFFRPKILEDAGTLGVKMTSPPWMSLNHGANTQFHGIHAFLHDYNFSGSDTSGFGLDIQYTLYFQCKGQS